MLVQVFYTEAQAQAQDLPPYDLDLTRSTSSRTIAQSK